MPNLFSKKLKPLFFILVAVFFAIGSRPAMAASGSLSLKIDTLTVAQGQQFVVGIRATSDTDINAIGAELNYPPDLLTVQDVSGPSVITLFITKGVVSNGTVTLEGGIQPAKTLAGDKVGVITFLAKKAGKATLSISGSSGLYANDGLGTNVITSRGSLTLDIGAAAVTPPAPPKPPAPPANNNANTNIPPAPTALTITSPTHPNSDAFYSQPSIAASWSAPNASAYATAFDQVDGTIPATATASKATAGQFVAQTDGVWYLHVRAEVNGVWGPAAEQSYRIDTTAPNLNAALSAGAILANETATVTFSATDDLSGVATYEMGVAKGGAAPVYKAVNSPQILKNLSPGKYDVTVRATDRAGNAATSVLTLVVSPGPAEAPWWTSWEVRAIGALVAMMLLAIFFIRFFLRREEKDKRK